MEDLADGLYEAMRTSALEERLRETLDAVPSFVEVDPADAPDVIARHVADAVRRAITNERDPSARVALTNQLLSVLHADGERLVDGVEQLRSITRRLDPVRVELPRPVTPLTQAALLTNTRGEPSLSAELRAELASADQVDLLCAFIRWPGIRVLENSLRNVAERGVPFRVITTTYTGATERRALDELVRTYGADVRISYEVQSTRLHAKAWLFRRNSGYHTAFVGSSNLSRSALLDGLEWNVRLSGVATPELIRKFLATFDTYWADAAFAPYDPDTDADTFDNAIAIAGNRGSTTPTAINLAGLEVRPLPHQELILEALATERHEHGRHNNLVVAATGTGKTVVAALDYRRLVQETYGRDLRLLVVAHRKEILEQSLRTYREVMVDGTFGELWVGGLRPERGRHLFASIQSLGVYGVDNISADQFDVVVVDEFHHAAAASYRRLLERLKPKELLGLTATPERSDGLDVLTYFGGRAAYELRLWDAQAADLLAPFHYFGIADDVDLTGISWRRGSYDTRGLDRVYTGNDARAAKVLRELRDKVTDVRQIRALGFCVSVAHAEYMARVFNDAGIPALAVSGQLHSDRRADAIWRLKELDVNVLFAADLFNEGLDIPAIDTVLFLRPTQSSTIFLQQLGRGLRRTYGKSVLTVLDFIGQHRKEFRFDVRYRALTGASRRGLKRQIEQGFPFLPSGSQIVLDPVSQQIVMANVRQQLQMNRRQLVADVKSHGDLSLADYLAEADRELGDVYKSRGSWTLLRREAGLPTAASGPDEPSLLKRVSALAHVDDAERVRVYARMADPSGPSYDQLTERDQRLARMLFFTLWPSTSRFASYQMGINHLRQHHAVCAEIAELASLGSDRARHLPRSLSGGLQHIPLATHARYRREEILAALGFASLARPINHREGVAWAEQTQTDALLVNLHKSEKDFSPTTMYRDYAISSDLFHWESQNTTSTSSPTGQRYLNHDRMGTHVLLFVRDSPSDDLGTAPFLCLGPVSYVEHQGEKPIAITWRLHRPMPADTFAAASVVAH